MNLREGGQLGVNISLVMVWATSKALLLKRVACSGERTWFRIMERNLG